MLALLLGLAACQSGPKTTKPEPVGDSSSLPDLEADFSVLTPTEEDIVRAFRFELDEQWLEAAVIYDQLAQSSVQPERSRYLIKVALMYYQGGLYDEIDPYFDALGEQDIEESDARHKQIVQAGGYLGEGKIYQSLLSLPEIEEIDDFSFKALALNIRSRGVLAIGKPLESARMRMQIREFLKTPQEIEVNNDFIWDALNRISEPAYGEHSAAPNYALSLLEESRRVYIEPKRIALMLPFSGRLEKVAEAIQNGFLYAYYQDPGQLAELEIINASSDPVEFNLQYEQAIQNGADFVVGPVDKNLVDLLQQREALDVPTLTLNYGNDQDEARMNLYQFGLRPEDEAVQIADFALAQGRHHALVLVPDTDWGYRLQRAFSKRFEALGGHVVGSNIYPARKNDYSTAITNLLNLTTSNHRRSILQQTIKEQVKFEARRRQDVDMIFIAANSRQARLIKPQLKFHHAQDLPVYATSHISTSNGKPADDRDLDEILFVDIPWMLDNRNNADYRQISTYWPDDSQRFSRLFALGIDAYRMIPSLRRLMINPEEKLQHHTGLLSVDKTGRVKRSLLMATYENGRAKLLQTPNTLTLQNGSIP
jgi:outer membrane PBP1 activator LpoA protein